MGILKVVESPESTTTTDIVQRIITNRASFLERNRKKEAKELAEIASRVSS